MGLLDMLKSADPATKQGLLQFGLSLLSTPGKFGPAVGQAGLQSLQATQQFRKQKQDDEYRKAQIADMQAQQADRQAQADFRRLQTKRLEGQEARTQQAISSFPQERMVQGPPDESGQYPMQKPTETDFMKWGVNAYGLDPALAQFGFKSAEGMASREDKQVAQRETQATLLRHQAEQAALARAAKLEQDAQNNQSRAERDKQHMQALAAIRASGGGRSANPFFQFLPTTNGIAVGDARSGTLRMGEIGGQPVVRPQDSPAVQGAIAEARESGKGFGEQAAMLQGKREALTSVSDAKKMIDAGIYTGAYANVLKTGAKLIPGVDTAKAARTEAFVSHIGNVVIPRLKEFGGNDSNEELKYLQKVMGGDITMEEATLRKVVEDSERKIKARIDQLNSRGAAQTQPNSGPQPGTVQGGYKFKGGDPADKANWEKM